MHNYTKQEKMLMMATAFEGEMNFSALLQW